MKIIVVICPGIHDPKLTENFLRVLKKHSLNIDTIIVFPFRYLAFSAFHILQFLNQYFKNNSHSFIFISFSAGVVGAIGAAWIMANSGQKIQAFIALDGWGVPLIGNFPIYRLSHDQFTDWSSALLGGGQESFYAEPPVAHLDLWKSPDQVKGWAIEKTIDGKEIYFQTTAIDFLVTLLKRYTPMSSLWY
jgi:hypothetical protein